jgi:CMP-N-acetylneuraminic acid synthetase
MAYSIKFALKLNVDRVICSTDSEQYSAVARSFGADVPFLRSRTAASDTAMEQDILQDLHLKFQEHGIPQPDILVWLRPTFIFRSLADVKECIHLMARDPSLTAARTVCETEGRLYRVVNHKLLPDFDDHGKSMIRRQEIGTRYRVYSTDVIRFPKDGSVSADFLGRNVAAIVTSKLCGLDIDDITDFEIAEAILLHKPQLVHEYL